MSKFGKCKKCPGNGPNVRLYGDGVCAYHLGHPGEDDSKKRIVVDTETGGSSRGKSAKALDLFFQAQIARLPPCCENCGRPLRGTPPGGMKSYVCHIVPKRHFKSVMLHPANCWFGCVNCHHNYDDRGWSSAATMKIWPTCLERFKQFMQLIPDTELRHLPVTMRELTNR